MNLFVKSLNFNFVFDSSSDWFYQARLSKKAKMKRKEKLAKNYSIRP